MRIPHLPSVDTVTCMHVPSCPSFGATDHEAAAVIAAHPEQGWNLLCNGVLVFDDMGEILPDTRTVGAHMNRAPVVTA